MRALLVDDERLARVELRSLLGVHPEVEVVGEAGDVPEAVERLRALDPDVVFLDIQMPGASGFEMLEWAAGRFKVIFVTAFDAYAVRAFEVNALDYLLKPVNSDRLRQAVDRLLGRAARDPERALEYDDHLFVSTDRKAWFVKVSRITCVCGAGDYSEIVTADGQRTLVQRSLTDWERRLPEKQFARVHRATIVNLDQVERVEKLPRDCYRVFLRGLDAPVAMSRRHASRLKALLV